MSVIDRLTGLGRLAPPAQGRVFNQGLGTGQAVCAGQTGAGPVTGTLGHGGGRGYVQLAVQLWGPLLCQDLPSSRQGSCQASGGAQREHGRLTNSGSQAPGLPGQGQGVG